MVKNEPNFKLWADEVEDELYDHFGHTLRRNMPDLTNFYNLGIEPERAARMIARIMDEE